jgi:DNA repair protein RecN (Recombination protein N)
MLQRLSIRNYALIQELSIDLRPGFTIITGETGAGKSILLGALALLLGERADPAVLRDPAKKCIVEAQVNIERYALSDFFKNNDLDEEATCILRREINPAGKSRAFINDTPVNLIQLRELGARLIDIHSQHDTLLLNSSAFQLQLLDAPAGNTAALSVYREIFGNWKKKKKELEELRTEEARLKSEQDFLQFQFDELEHARIQPNEVQIIEQEFTALSHSEEIKTHLAAAVTGLDDETQGALQALKHVQFSLQQAAKFATNATSVHARVQSTVIELRDILAETEEMSDKLEADPKRLEALRTRLDQLNHLLNKHRCSNSDGLILLHQQFEERLHQAASVGEDLNRLERELDSIYAQVMQQAVAISARRKTVVPSIVKESTNLLQRLGMPKTTLHVELSERDQPEVNGIDKVKILFSANAGSLPQELSKVASGGELSRLMLSLKKIIAGSVSLPTIIFDEIDTGVSGAVADSMGEILKEMGTELQVLAITHLPQIASKGNDHLKVIKSTVGSETTSQLIRLNQSDRIDEIAGMLSGKELSDAAISNARSLLGIGS